MTALRQAPSPRPCRLVRFTARWRCIPARRPNFPCFMGREFGHHDSGKVANWIGAVHCASLNFCGIPCKFPLNRETTVETGSLRTARRASHSEALAIFRVSPGGPELWPHFRDLRQSSPTMSPISEGDPSGSQGSSLEKLCCRCGHVAAGLHSLLRHSTSCQHTKVGSRGSCERLRLAMYGAALLSGLSQANLLRQHCPRKRGRAEPGRTSVKFTGRLPDCRQQEAHRSEPLEAPQPKASRPGQDTRDPSGNGGAPPDSSHTSPARLPGNP
jgi:hypothetical protein